ncbi:MAG: phosphoenolpyruvate synthase, partial [Candidatus Aenigmatarchaeota archaeon]
MAKGKFILWFDEAGLKDSNRVGGKNSSLGEMYSKLKKSGVRVPNGFATTTDAYWHFLEKAGIRDDILGIIRFVGRDKSKIRKAAPRIRGMILRAPMPEDLEREIVDAY